jgi:K+-transporting ATPase ATPase C chain
MLSHLRAAAWLLCFTLLLCSVVYPLTLLGIGATVFPRRAEGSILRDKDGKAIGSRLIAQPFSKDEYFQPRPSAVSYKADASGASNYAPSNYLLRDRVARQLGPMVRYRGHASSPGDLVAPAVEKWFQSKPGIVAQWAEQHEGVARAWVNADAKHKEAVASWLADHPQVVADWKTKNPDSGDPKEDDLAVDFFKSNAATFHASWPKLIDDSAWSVPAVFFDMWRQEHPDVELADVPADMVMTSGSGLDPHITLKNAEYQLDRVAGAWAKKTSKDERQVRNEIADLLRDRAEAPLGGLVGVKLINVLEINLALRDRYESQVNAAN